VIKARRALVRKIEAFADAVASAHNPNVESVDSDVAADDFENAIDAFAAAVRAEALSPATSGQSAELEDAEECLRVGCGHERTWESVVAAELDRLRARLAAAEAEIAELRKLCERAAMGVRGLSFAHLRGSDLKPWNELASELESAARRAWTS
jgi:phage shock protein A